jgi:carboxylesterase type B
MTMIYGAKRTLHRLARDGRHVCAVAKTGNPNGAAVPEWPTYPSPDYRMLDFGDRLTVRSNAQFPQVAFFRRAFETMRGK